MLLDLRGQHVDEVDDLLGAAVAGGGLRAEDEGARRNAEVRVVADPVVQHEDVQRVEQLALVLVQALHLYVKHRLRIEHQALVAVDPGDELLFIMILDGGELLLEGRVVGEGHQSLQLHQVLAPALADGLVEQRGQLGIGEHEPGTSPA